MEKQNNSNQNINKKLIIEMLFEIFIELFLEFKKNSNEQECSLFEALINDLLISKSSEIEDDKNNNKSKNDTKKGTSENDNNKKNHKNHSVFYRIDELYIKQNNKKLINFNTYILTKYLKDNDPNNQVFSSTILFLIKLTIYIKKLEDIDKECSLLDFFIRSSELLCKDAYTLQKRYASSNPLISKNKNNKELYDEFQNYILKDYFSNKTYKKEVLLSKINKSYKSSKTYDCIPFKAEENPRLFSIKSHMQLIASDKKLNLLNPMGSSRINSRRSTIKAECTPFNLLETNKGINKRNTFYSKTFTDLKFVISKKDNNQLINYKIMPKFSNFFVRNNFSIYFLKLLTYDEDFSKMQKIYNYIYHNEINNINSYNLDYPTKLKNRLGNNYVKHFLKKILIFYQVNIFNTPINVYIK